jgi:hypothetical protein
VIKGGNGRDKKVETGDKTKLKTSDKKSEDRRDNSGFTN